jgi:hypothetical protein
MSKLNEIVEDLKEG